MNRGVLGWRVSTAWAAAELGRQWGVGADRTGDQIRARARVAEHGRDAAIGQPGLRAAVDGSNDLG